MTHDDIAAAASSAGEPTGWEKLLQRATLLMLAGIVGLTVWALRTGLDTNEVVTNQDEAAEVGECRSAYASASDAAAVKYRHAQSVVSSAQTVLILAVAEVGETTVPEAVDRIVAANETLAVADAEQVRFSRLRLRSNKLCDPPGPPDKAPPIFPPSIAPPTVEDFTD